MRVIPIGNIKMGHVFTLCVDTVIGQLRVMETNCLLRKNTYTLCINNKKIYFFSHRHDGSQTRQKRGKRFGKGKNQPSVICTI